MKDSAKAFRIIGTALLFFMIAGPVTFEKSEKLKVHGAQPPDVSKTPGSLAAPVPVPYPKSRNAFKGAKGTPKKSHPKNTVPSASKMSNGNNQGISTGSIKAMGGGVLKKGKAKKGSVNRPNFRSKRGMNRVSPPPASGIPVGID